MSSTPHPGCCAHPDLGLLHPRMGLPSAKHRHRLRRVHAQVSTRAPVPAPCELTTVNGLVRRDRGASRALALDETPRRSSVVLLGRPWARFRLA